MNALRPTLTALAALGLLAASPLSRADSDLKPTIEPAVLPTVSTTLQRQQDALAYREVHRWLQGVDQWGEGLYRWDFTLKTKSGQALPSPLKLALATDDAYLPLALDAQGVFHLPTLPAEAVATAELAANVERGSLSVTWTLAPTPQASTLRAGDVQRLLRVALTLRDKLFAWYQRPVRAPLPLYIRVCAAEGAYAYTWEDGDGANATLRRLDLPPAAPASDGPAAPCVRLTGKEAAPPEAHLVGPSGPLASARIQLRHAKDN